MRGSKTPSLFDIPDPTRSGRDELNFVEFPIALLSDRPAANVSELEFSDSVRDKNDGRVVERKVQVLGVEPHGLPNAKDEEILLGLISLTKLKNNLASRSLRFTRYELAKHLRWPTDGKSYRRIDEALHRWVATTLSYTNSWWDAEDEVWKNVLFHVIETLIIAKPTAQGKIGAVEIEWSSVAFKSFNSGYVKYINLPFYQSLESAASKRLYRYLDKLFYRSPRLEFDLCNLAFEKVGLSRDYEPWKVKQKLQPAIKELEERGYIEKLPPAERFEAAGRGRWRIIFTMKARARNPEMRAAEGKTTVDSPLVAELVSRGVHRDSARRLVAERQADDITVRIEAFDWLMGTKNKPEKPSGYLYTSIEREYPLPDGFVPAEALKRQAEEKKRKAVETSRKNRAADDSQKAERTRELERRTQVDVFLASLDTEGRKAFEERALATGPEELVSAYRKAVDLKVKVFAESSLYRLLEAVMNQKPDAIPA